MGLYNFQPRFVPYIRARTKKHTIRATRKHQDRPGSKMYLYHGLRTKKAELISIEECVAVQEIRIEQKFQSSSGTNWIDIIIDDYTLGADEREELARRDGFNNFAEMVLFWDGRLPFEGHIFHWK